MARQFYMSLQFKKQISQISFKYVMYQMLYIKSCTSVNKVFYSSNAVGPPSTQEQSIAIQQLPLHFIHKMATQLTEFHYHLSQGGKVGLFDFEAPTFDIKNIYNHYLRKHERTGVSVAVDSWLAPQLSQWTTGKRDYEQLYVKTKVFSNLAQRVYDKQAAK